MKAGVYKLTVGDMIYWGSTKNLNHRKSKHRADLIKGRHCNRILQNAFDKFQTYQFDIIVELDNADERAEWEQELIDVWFGSEKCANILSNVGATPSHKGKVRSKETRAKMSARKRKHSSHSEETKARISASKKGHKHSIETRTKMSEARKLYHIHNSLQKTNANIQYYLPEEN